MNGFVTAFWKEWTSAIRDRRELFSAFAYTLAGPLLIAVMVTLTARDMSRDEPLAYRLCDGSAHWASLDAWLASENFARDDAAALCIAIPPEALARFDSGQRARIAVEANLNTSEKEAARLKAALEAYGRALAEDRLIARGVAPLAIRPLSVATRNSAAVSTQAQRLVGALILFLVCAPFFISLSTAIDTTAGERERRGLEPMLTQPVSYAALIGAKFAMTFAVGAIGTFATILIGLFVIGHTPIAELGIRVAVDPGTALVASVMLLPLAAAVAAIQLAIGLRSKTFKEGQTWALLFAFTPVALGIPAFMGSQGAPPPWPVMFEIGALRAPLLGIDWPAPETWLAAAGLAFAVTAIALAACVRRLGDERLLAEG